METTLFRSPRYTTLITEEAGDDESEPSMIPEKEIRVELGRKMPDPCSLWWCGELCIVQWKWEKPVNRPE